MDDHHLTPNHYYAFGYLISTYAKVEQGFKILIGVMTGLQTYLVGILTEPCSTAQLRNVVSSLYKQCDLPEEAKTRLCELIGDFKSFGRLRNEIGHCMWTVGTRPNSIKPINLDIRSGSVKLTGVDAGEIDWTIEELDAEAMRLRPLHSRQIKLTQDLGYASEIEP